MKFGKSIVTILLLITFTVSVQIALAEETYNPMQRPVNEMVQNDFANYMQNLQEKLRTTWQPPDFMEEGHVRVCFKLNRQGRIMSSSVIESSGNDIYDESALEALKNGAPYGEFPENTMREFITVKYSFDTILIEEERMNGYYELAKRNLRDNPQRALEYLDMAINKVGGEEASSFLYKKRAEIKESLGDNTGAKEDYEIYNTYTTRANIKRVHLLKHLAETKPSVFIYHYLAYAYEQINDYDNAIIAIDKAIALADAKPNLETYKKTLINKQQGRTL